MRIRRLRDRFALLLAAALGTAGLTAVPAAGADGTAAEVHGLKGEYYTQSAPGAFDFHELKATAFDPQLDFDNLEPRLNFTTGQSDDVSVRWTGKLVPERTGAHTFSVSADNGFRLWVDGKLAIDHWVDDWDREQTAEPIELTAGRPYDFKMEYFEHYGGSNLHLRWTEPGGAKEAVPRSAFRLPDGFDYNGPTAATVLPTGRTLKLDFAQPLAVPPAGLADHLDAVIGGARWPLGTVRRDPADPAALLVGLAEPVVGNKTGTARGTADLRYDGEGGLTDTEGNVVSAFLTSGPNRSTYELRTEWADEVGPDNAHPEYPRPQLTRADWRNLNGRWQFAAAEAGERPPVGKDLGERILVPYPVESQLSGVQRHEDRMWYRRTFTVPKNWHIGSGQRLKLNFGAVDWQSEVYVNGTKVAEHKGGYDKFGADITDALKPGRTQELIVGVYDPTDAAGGENPPMGKQRLDPSGIWYTPSSGIWQTVWMEPVARDHVDSLKLTPDTDASTLTVEPRGVRDGVRVTATAYAGHRKVATATGRTGSPLTLRIANPRLWSPDDPFLYDLKVTVGADRVGSYFGMRSIAVEKVDGVPRTVLNGEPVFLMATLGLGLAVPGHAWSVQQSYVDVDPATYTDDYLAKLAEVRALVCRGSNGAVYTQISNVEGELNGLTTYDRKVLKPDVPRVRAAHEALIRDASRPVPAGCPAA
ncbi:Hydrolase OS=Streptomyces fumanus OX=67302 GN=GCM10018772_56570 PE=3 SV=1 [Streptomyces fumanus]